MAKATSPSPDTSTLYFSQILAKLVAGARLRSGSFFPLCFLLMLLSASGLIFLFPLLTPDCQVNTHLSRVSSRLTDFIKAYSSPSGRIGPSILPTNTHHVHNVNFIVFFC